MSEICDVCGLPKDLCVCETIAKETQRITVRIEKRKFGKMYTVVEGFDSKEIDVKELTRKLKSKLACGGTSKRGSIELQGAHGSKVKQYLVELG
ncbi:translation initiation factor, partial [Candidatus Woesearchaeota archaeon]|nr:translation initiation factor [Candidatus Woesearchaeota archaeon]